MQAPQQDLHTSRSDVVVREGRHVDTGRRSVAAPALGLGGLALIVGSVLSWASDASNTEVDGFNSSINGTSIADGRTVMGIGLALLLMALYMGATRRRGHWFDADLLGMALSTIAGVIVVTTWIALPDGRSPDIGLYVALAGALIAFIGAVAALMRSRESDRGTYA